MPGTDRRSAELYWAVFFATRLAGLRVVRRPAACFAAGLRPLRGARLALGLRPSLATIGASRASQVVDCVRALEKPDFTTEELAEINVYAKEADINLWASSAERD